MRYSLPQHNLNSLSEWIVSHPTVLTPAKLGILISDDEDNGVLSNIGEYPEVKLAIEKFRELEDWEK